MSAITALTAQNTTGVTAIMESTPEFLGEQLESIFTDIYPDAVKIGMVSSSSLIKTISDKLKSTMQKYCCRSGYGGNKRSKAYQRRGGKHSQRASLSACNSSYTEYSGGGSSL